MNRPHIWYNCLIRYSCFFIGKEKLQKSSEPEVPVSARQLLNEKYQGDDDIVRMVRNRSNAELQELIEWKNKVEDLNDLEKKQLDKVLNTVKNMTLKVGDGKTVMAPKSNSSAEAEQNMASNSVEVKGKPPIVPGSKPSEKHALEKSPRFVRKKESFRAASFDQEEVCSCVFQMTPHFKKFI